MVDTGAHTDEEMALRVQKGDTDAFGVLMQRYEPRLSRYAKRFLIDTDGVDDVVQETFIDAYRNIQGFDTARSFSPWIYRIAHNQAINALRKKKRSVPVLEFDTLITIPSSENIEEESDRARTKALVDEHLAKLNATYREVLTLYYLEDMDYASIAHVLRIPLGTVGVRLRRARGALARVLASHVQ